MRKWVVLSALLLSLPLVHSGCEKNRHSSHQSEHYIDYLDEKDFYIGDLTLSMVDNHFSKGMILYCTYDQVRVRKGPDTNDEVLAYLPEGEEMMYYGERTDRLGTFTLRNEEITAPWLYVQLKDGTIGWIFGGTVQTNPLFPITDTRTDEDYYSNIKKTVKNAGSGKYRIDIGNYLDLNETIANAPEGSVITIESNIYFYQDAIEVIGKTNIMIVGEKNPAIVITDIWDNVITVRDSQNVIIADIQAAHEEKSSCSGDVIFITNSEYIAVSNCFLAGCGIIGVNMESSESVQVADSILFDNSFYGIRADSDCKNVLINGNVFLSNGWSEHDSHIGIDIEPKDPLIIKNATNKAGNKPFETLCDFRNIRIVDNSFNASLPISVPYAFSLTYQSWMTFIVKSIDMDDSSLDDIGYLPEPVIPTDRLYPSPYEDLQDYLDNRIGAKTGPVRSHVIGSDSLFETLTVYDYDIYYLKKFFDCSETYELVIPDYTVEQAFAWLKRFDFFEELNGIPEENLYFVIDEFTEYEIEIAEDDGMITEIVYELIGEFGSDTHIIRQENDGVYVFLEEVVLP